MDSKRARGKHQSQTTYVRRGDQRCIRRDMFVVATLTAASLTPIYVIGRQRVFYDVTLEGRRTRKHRLGVEEGKEGGKGTNLTKYVHDQSQDY